MVSNLLLLLSTKAFCGALIILTVGRKSLLVDAASLHRIRLLRDLLSHSHGFVQLDLRFEFSHKRFLNLCLALVEVAHLQRARLVLALTLA